MRVTLSCHRSPNAGGSELQPLVKVLDNEVAGFIGTCLGGSVRALSVALGLDKGSASGPSAGARPKLPVCLVCLCARLRQ